MYTAIRSNMIKGAGWQDFRAIRPEMAIEGVELLLDQALCVTDLVPESFDLSGPEGRGRLKAYLQELNLKPAAFLLPTDFSSAALEDQIHWIVRAGEAAADLGMPTVRVDMLTRQKLPDEEFVTQACRSMQTVLQQAPADVCFGVENHGRLTNDPDWLTTILNRIDSPRFGVTLDSGNFYWAGWPLSQVYEYIDQFASRAVHVHLKNIAYPSELKEQTRELGWKYREYASPLPDGDVDHTRVLASLKQAGYQGGLAIEDECLGRYTEAERQVIVMRDIAYVNDCLDAVMRSD